MHRLGCRCLLRTMVPVGTGQFLGAHLVTVFSSPAVGREWGGTEQAEESPSLPVACRSYLRGGKPLLWSGAKTLFFSFLSPLVTVCTLCKVSVVLTAPLER